MKLLHAKGQIEDVCSVTIHVRVPTLLLRIGEYKYPVLVIPDTMESITVQATMEMALSSQAALSTRKSHHAVLATHGNPALIRL